MRHARGYRRLNRTHEHRKALFKHGRLAHRT